MKLQLRMLDAIAPFFSACQENTETNWSKIPFARLESNGVIDELKAQRIREAFEIFIQRARADGYNALTLDDVAHLALHSFYPQELKEKILSYQQLYTQLIQQAHQAGFKVFLTTDIMFFNQPILSHTRARPGALMGVLARSIRKIFKQFDAVEGIVLRFGESDGMDVADEFESRMVIRTPRQLRSLLRTLLPLFEHYDKQLIVRTWTVGAFSIGDLMWNRSTYEQAFGSLTSDNLIISMKYGESDFFRYLNFNSLFFYGHHRRIIEVQARREYEGFGEFPSYIGKEYERYARYARQCPTIIGLSVWCQTGGWSHFTPLTYLPSASLWNELNTFVAVQIFEHDRTAEDAAQAFARRYLPEVDENVFVDMLKLADRIIRDLWYLPEFSTKRIYFRRTRVPPLLWIFWDTIIINHTMRKVLRSFVHERREAVIDGYRTLHKIKTLRELSSHCMMDSQRIDYMYDTFAIIATAREYYLGKWDASLPGRIAALVQTYHSKYPHGFHVECDFAPVRLKKWLIKALFSLSLRTHPQYRLIDRILIIRCASLVYPLVHLWQKRRIPEFARQQAMGIQVLFK